MAVDTVTSPLLGGGGGTGEGGPGCNTTTSKLRGLEEAVSEHKESKQAVQRIGAYQQHISLSLSLVSPPETRWHGDVRFSKHTCCHVHTSDPCISVVFLVRDRRDIPDMLNGQVAVYVRWKHWEQGVSLVAKSQMSWEGASAHQWPHSPTALTIMAPYAVSHVQR